MTEVDWGSETKEAPKAKKRIPGWLWFCGGGCALAVLVAIAVGIGAVMIGRKAMNQDQQWQELAKVIPVERPDDKSIVIFGMSWVPGLEAGWQIQHGNEYQAQVFVMSGDDADKIRESLSENGDADALKPMIGALGKSQATRGTTTLQGREFPSVTFQPIEGEEEEKDGNSAMRQVSRALNPPGVLLDFTPAGGTKLVLVAYKKLGSSEPVSQEELDSFFAPFHLAKD